MPFEQTGKCARGLHADEIDSANPTDIDDRPLINTVRQEVFAGARPASTLVEGSRLALDGARLEVEAVAVVDENCDRT